MRPVARSLLVLFAIIAGSGQSLGAGALTGAFPTAAGNTQFMPPAGGAPQGGRSPANRGSRGFSFPSGPYTVRFARRAGELLISRRGTRGALAVSEVPGSRATDVLHHVTKITFTRERTLIAGRTSWGRFRFFVTFRASVLHWRLAVRAAKTPPMAPPVPDVQTVRPTTLRPYAEPLVTYAQATPVAGSSVFVGDRAMRTAVLYFANFTALGKYFGSTSSDPTQGSFSYPGSSTESPVGVSGSRFGYEATGTGLQAIPLHRWLTVVDSYLVLSALPAGQSEAAQQYLTGLDRVVRLVAAPAISTPPWRSIASKEIGDLSNGQNWDAARGHRFLKSYVSDTRISPELITQLSVLLGLREFRAHASRSRSGADRMISRLDSDLPLFFNSSCATVTNSLGPGPASQEESWYYLTNLISLLQLARLGDRTARRQLLDSVGTTVRLAHKVHYLFPMVIQCPSLATGGGLQRDVAGGYAYLMLGLFDMTHRTVFRREAEASLTRLLGVGFFLSYELHMTAYGAAAAAMLYRRTGKAVYRRVIAVTLANFFNSVRLWDCTYGSCAHGRYHTYMGLNPLPWSDYIAMREQYESWLALSAFLSSVGGTSQRRMESEVDLVRRFVRATPSTMQYALPTHLPRVAETSKPSQYSFVSRNMLRWDIPLEDLRQGLAVSGEIGQEIYGAGGPLIFAALSGNRH